MKISQSHFIVSQLRPHIYRQLASHYWYFHLIFCHSHTFSLHFLHIYFIDTSLKYYFLRRLPIFISLYRLIALRYLIFHAIFTVTVSACFFFEPPLPEAMKPFFPRVADVAFTPSRFSRHFIDDILHAALRDGKDPFAIRHIAHWVFMICLFHDRPDAERQSHIAVFSAAFAIPYVFFFVCRKPAFRHFLFLYQAFFTGFSFFFGFND